MRLFFYLSIVRTYNLTIDTDLNDTQKPEKISAVRVGACFGMQFKIIVVVAIINAPLGDRLY